MKYTENTNPFWFECSWQNATVKLLYCTNQQAIIHAIAHPVIY